MTAGGGWSSSSGSRRTGRSTSISPNTLRAYSGALRRLDAWLAGRALEDATLAGHLAELHEQEESSVERVDGGGRGALPGPASSASRALPGNGRPGSSRATGGPPSR